ncbi:MAG: hypothetical protein P8P84_02145, partial [Paracoccaceae bacterium]|nr:hypothetical protein [Paracoccaceae bacterium]
LNHEKTSIDLTQQNSLKWIDYGWVVSHPFPAACTFLFHFPKIWFETSDFSRKRSHCAPQAL